MNSLASFVFAHSPLCISAEYVLVLAALALAIAAGVERRPAPASRALISPGASAVLKAVCCILVVLHHFALRRPDVAFIKPFAVGAGHFAMPVFFALSAYGVCKSEMARPMPGFAAFFRKRVLSLLKQLWAVNFFAIAAYAAVGAIDGSAESMARSAENPLFFAIASHSLQPWELLMLLVGIRELDSVVWFLYVVIYAYMAFFVSKGVFPIVSRRCAFACLYVGLVALFGVAAWALGLPAYYYRNLWALPLGLLMALCEPWLLGGWRRLCALLCPAGVLLLAQCALLREGFYLVPAVAAVAALLGCGRFMACRSVRRGSALAWLSAMSPMVYLVHIKVFDIECHCMGFPTVLLPLAATLALSALYVVASRRKP